jgi:hypothetical protein
VRRRINDERRKNKKKNLREPISLVKRIQAIVNSVWFRFSEVKKNIRDCGNWVRKNWGPPQKKCQKVALKDIAGWRKDTTITWFFHGKKESYIHQHR